MRKLCCLVIILMFCSAMLSSIDFPDVDKAVEIMPVYFVADTTAFIGFSTADVVSISKPDTDEEQFEFKFNDVSGNYETSDIYYYIQAFQTGTYKCTVSMDRTLSGGDDSISYEVQTSSMPDGWNANVNADGTYSVYGNLVIEANTPDYLCGFLILSFPGDQEFNENIQYAGTLTIECSVES